MIRIDGNSGFTLVELILVIVIIGIIASVAITSFLPASERARADATIVEMDNIAIAIIGNPDLVSDGLRSDYGYVGDFGALPPNLDALVANPGGGAWNGPYILNNFAENIEDYKKDGWGDYYTYSGGVIIASNGGGSPITRQFAGNVSELINNTVNGNIFDGLGSAPGDSSSRVTVSIAYPDGAGSVTSASTSPNLDGSFVFSNVIPIGNHLLTAVYSVTNDSTARYVSVVPGSSVYCQMRFSGSLW